MRRARFLREPVEKSKRDQALLGYAAGVLDCDGSIWVCRSMRKSGAFSYRLRLNVTNTRKPLLEWFAEQFDCGGITTSRREKYAAWKTCYAWTIAGNDTAVVLRLLLPYLVIKRKQALLALEFGSTHVTPGVKLTDNFVQHRERIYQEMRKINARGKT